MKTFYFILLFAINANSLFGQGTGYISLEGRQFKDAFGDDFYPIICNYGFALTFTNLGNYYLSPNSSYGEGYACTSCDPLPNYDFDKDNQSDCLKQIHDELTRIHDMRFNVIRTYGLAPFKTDPNKVGVIGFNLEATENKHPIYANASVQLLPISPTPYAYDDPLNTNVQLLFSFYDLILQEAQACSLKVLLDVAYDDIAAHPIDVADYASYLSALADRYKNNSALMGYVVIEEPSYNQHNTGHTKQEICDITSQWYDAIKAKDSHHLITMGGSDLVDILEWDPGVMKLDFYCPHIYPRIIDYENYSITNAFDRVLGDLIWITGNSPMPWLVGETAFSAYDDSYYNTNHTSQIISSPRVDGSVQEQAAYGQYILDAVRNTNGSGISWWNYQEHWWGSDLQREDGYGLLRHGPLTDGNIEKPITMVFRNYPLPPPNPVPITSPSNYLNLLNLIPSSYSYSGTVFEEGTTNPIKDAIVFGWTRYYLPDNTGDNIPEEASDFIYTFTNKVDGSFTLHPLNPNAILNTYISRPLTELTKVTVSTAGAEREPFGPEQGTPLPSSIYLNIAPFNFDLQVSNEIIDAANSPRNYKGWNTLKVNNVSVISGGISDMKAKREISVEADFHAENGSELHVFCAPAIFSDCSIDLNGFLRMVNNATAETNLTIPAKEIELDFSPKFDFTFLELKPNPNDGIFTVEIKSSHNEILKNKIQIFDIVGNILFQEETTNNISSLNLISVAKGIYYVHLNNQFSSFNQKIIIQ